MITSGPNNDDDAIIDVSNQSYKIDSDYGLDSKVPTWVHHYVYSYSEINSASKEQKKFYIDFKVNFLQGEYLDLEGNTNYAFILLFDLLNQYDSHKDIPKLESQFRILGEKYPKTKMYAINFLIKKMQAAGDKEGILRINSERYDYYNSQVSYSTYEWRNKYKKKLNLDKEEIDILDTIWYSGNNFLNIEFCCTEVIKIYIATIKKLKSNYAHQGTSLDAEFKNVAEIFAGYKQERNDYKYVITNFISEFYTIIFKHCENNIRDYYGHKRKLSTELNIDSTILNTEFEEKIINPAIEIISILRLNAGKPDKETEKTLNSLNTNRWKGKLEKIEFGYKNNPNRFFEKVVLLGEENSNNPAVENIFFEASKFFSEYNKEIALKLYIYYLYYDIKSVVFDNKQLTKTIQKNLFSTNEQLHDFQIIISNFISEKDLEKALNAIPQVYSIKRKKIQLDITSIKEVQKQHSGTVELLNEYLKDEYEDENNSFKTEEISEQEIKIEITQKNNENYTSRYLSTLTFTATHTLTLELFTKNNYSLLQSELESFAKSQGAFKNQLIDSINEICYEDLDDVLIEEDEEYYTINENYYQRLIANDRQH